MYAYEPTYLERARTTMGSMLEYAVHDQNLSLKEFYPLFLSTGIASRFEKGEAKLLAGMSGAELAAFVMDCAGLPLKLRQPTPKTARSEEYWTGWAVTYYQWETNRSFSEINKRIPISHIRDLYSPFHEMDIRHFSDEINRQWDEYDRKEKEMSSLARLRKYAALSQGMLAERSGVPVRSIQQYEQGQKLLSRAGADTVDRLAKSLQCSPESLLF